MFDGYIGAALFSYAVLPYAVDWLPYGTFFLYPYGDILHVIQIIKTLHTISAKYPKSSIVILSGLNK